MGQSVLEQSAVSSSLSGAAMRAVPLEGGCGAMIEGVDLTRDITQAEFCLLYTSPSPRDRQKSRMPSSA